MALRGERRANNIQCQGTTSTSTGYGVKHSHSVLPGVQQNSRKAVSSSTIQSAISLEVGSYDSRSSHMRPS